MKKIIFLIIKCFVLVFFAINQGVTYGSDTLLIFYSRTGKTQIVADTLRQNLDIDALEIEELKDRSATWGYITAAYDAFMHNHSPIEPEKIDMTGYNKIIIASPIWSWNLCTPIHTLFEKNRFDGKKLVLVTTANIHIMKYEKFGEDAGFIKKFLRDYLRDKREAAANEILRAGGNFVGHCHIETKNKTEQEISGEAQNCGDYIKEKFFQ
jgi:flavodoxin